MGKIDFLILGADGMQGNIVSKDLIGKKFNIICSDLGDAKLKDFVGSLDGYTFKVVDLRNEAGLNDLLAKYNPRVVINCAEGDYNLSVYKSCLAAGCNVIDLGSDIPMTEQQLNLNGNFQKKGLVAITGCGSTPGINNIMTRYAARKLDRMDYIEAGFAWKSNKDIFIPPFSLSSILFEFNEPATVVENGEFKQYLPMDTAEDYEIGCVDCQKKFLVIHSEPYTFFRAFKDKGVKNIKFFASFPEHAFNSIRTLTDIGFRTPPGKTIEVEGKPVNIEAFLREMGKAIKIPEDYIEEEILWAKLVGTSEGKDKTIMMQCYTKTLPGWFKAGCNIDTGIPASVMAQMVHSGEIKEPGSYSPEDIVPENSFFSKIKDYGIEISEDGKRIN